MLEPLAVLMAATIAVSLHGKSHRVPARRAPAFDRPGGPSTDISQPAVRVPESPTAERESARPPEPIQADDIEWTGRFVDGEGRPVPNVLVLPRGARSRREPYAQSDAAGRVRVRFPSRCDGALASRWRATAEVPGFESLDLRIGVHPGMRADLGDFVLERGMIVRFAVRSNDGRPVTRITALPVDVGDDALFCRRDCSVWKLESEDGEFELPSLPLRDDLVRMLVRSEQGAQACTRAGQRGSGHVIDLGVVKLAPLPDEGWVRGVVRSASGAPLDGVSVSYDDRTGAFLCRTGSVVTRADGRFALRFEPVPWGERRFRHLPDGESAPKSEEGTLALWATTSDGMFARGWQPGLRLGDDDIEIVLQPMHEMRLRVADRLGAPVENFSWSWRWRRGLREGSAESIEAHHPGGIARVRVHPGLYELAIQSSTHVRRKLGPFDGARLPQELSVVLASRPGISGTVVHAGRPVVGARVAVLRDLRFESLGALLPEWREEGFELRGAPFVRTDARGQFRLGFSNANGPHRVRVWADGLSQATTSSVEHGQKLEIELAAAGTLVGQVRGDSDLELSGASVALWRSPSRPAGSIQHARVDGRGAFCFERIARGPWFIKLLVPRVGRDTPLVTCSFGFGPATRVERDPRTIQRLCIVEAGKTSRYELDLRNDDLCRLNGRVQIDGEPLHAFARLSAIGGGTALEVDHVSAARDGTFQLATRAPGRYRIVVGNSSTGLIATDVVELSYGTTLWEPRLTAEVLRKPIPLDLPSGQARPKQATSS